MKLFISTLALILVANLCFAQAPNKKHGISLQVLQIESYVNYKSGIKPIFDFGIGYDRIIKNNFGAFAMMSFKKGAYDYDSRSTRFEGNLNELNLKLGIYHRWRILPKLHVLIKFNSFLENMKLDEVSFLGEEGIVYVQEYEEDSRFLGLETGAQFEYEFLDRLKFYILTSYQVGILRRANNLGVDEPGGDDNFNLLESIGFRYLF